MSTGFLKCPTALVLACLAWTSIPTAISWAEDAPAAEEKPAAEAAPAADPYAVPEGSTEDLVAFIEKLLKQRPVAQTQVEFDNFAKAQAAIVTASDKVLAGQPTAEQRLLVVRAKLTALTIQEQLTSGAGNNALKIFAESLVDDPDAAIATEARQVVLRFKAKAIGQLEDADAAKLLDELLAFVRGAGEPNMAHLQLAFIAGDALEEAGKTDLAAKTYQSFAEIFVVSENSKLASYGHKMAGSARRVALVGKPLELTGALPDGSAFDWAQYKGKVVLVDFWATWCGPCRGELPNVKEQYARYHDKGFEVVGVSLDENKQELEDFIKANELSWVTLFSADPEATGWDHPMATYYGIMSIPATILVDQQGNVVTLKAREEALGQELEKLLGPAEGEKKE